VEIQESDNTLISAPNIDFNVAFQTKWWLQNCSHKNFGHIAVVIQEIYFLIYLQFKEQKKVHLKFFDNMVLSCHGFIYQSSLERKILAILLSSNVSC